MDFIIYDMISRLTKAESIFKNEFTLNGFGFLWATPFLNLFSSFVYFRSSLFHMPSLLTMGAKSIRDFLSINSFMKASWIDIAVQYYIATIEIINKNSLSISLNPIKLSIVSIVPSSNHSGIILSCSLDNQHLGICYISHYFLTKKERYNY